mmetsp:Transcript_9290/g.13815  ORF Transcript_9290/g.13815 Transcript_9290/m.13815 type:complete len:230 (+) Transcript_9290:26-715(+)
MVSQKAVWVVLLFIVTERNISEYFRRKGEWTDCKFPLSLWSCVEFCSITLVLVLNLLSIELYQSRTLRRHAKLFGIVPFLLGLSLVWTILGIFWTVEVLKSTPECLPEPRYKVITRLVTSCVYWCLTCCLVVVFSIALTYLVAADTAAINGDFPQVVREGLDQEGIQNLKREVCESPFVCSICLENVVVGNEVIVLPNCFHKFHDECVSPWLVRNAICPYCRTEIQFEV